MFGSHKRHSIVSMVRTRNAEQLLNKILNSDPSFLAKKPIALFGAIQTSADKAQTKDSENSAEERDDNSEDASFKGSGKLSDSFDEDFFSKEEESSQDSDESEGTKAVREAKRRSRIMNLLNRKKQPEKYFKKGFDIRTLTLGGGTEQRKKVLKKDKRRPKKNTIGVVKHCFLHEVYSQRELIKAALMNENIKLLKERLHLKDDTEAIKAADAKTSTDKLLWRSNNRISPTGKTETIVWLRDNEAERDYFGEQINRQNSRTRKQSRVSLQQDGGYETLKRAQSQLSDLSAFLDRKKITK